MGLRSWLTRVDEVSDYLGLCSQIRHNPLAYGVVYVINITKKKGPRERGVWVAWSGDTASSVSEVMSPYFADRTLLLDNFLDECQDYNDNPSQYGTFPASEADVIGWLTRNEGCGDEDICTKLKEEISFGNECYTELSKFEKFREYEKRWEDVFQGLEEVMLEIEETESVVRPEE